MWLWKDWPGRWGADAGIDLVGETTDGKVWAIQAKAYAPAYRVKKSDRTLPAVLTLTIECSMGPRLTISSNDRSLAPKKYKPE